MRHSAGLLIISGDRMLLLKRAKTTGNGGTWGLPGGRLDQSEARYAGACRESTEELRQVPKHVVADSICVARGRRGRRRYDVFVCRARRKLVRAWKPTLNAEHLDYRWADLSWCRGHVDVLHPVVRALVEDRGHRQRLRRVTRGRDGR